MQDSMVVQLIDSLFEISPSWQTQLELFLCASQTSAAGRARRIQFFWIGSGCAKLDRVLKEDEKNGGCGPHSFAILQYILITGRRQALLLILVLLLQWNGEQFVQSHVEFAKLLIIHGLYRVHHAKVVEVRRRHRAPSEARIGTWCVTDNLVWHTSTG